jgi:dCMP deaminase
MNDKWSWDKYFLDMAEHASIRSKDPTTKVGAVIVNDRNAVVSTGYNGLPQGIEDKEEILTNRDLKIETIIHGEVNALIFAEQCVRGCTLYTYPFICCSRCASIMIQAGIKRNVAPKNVRERWEANLVISRKMFKEAGVECVEYDWENLKS